MPTRIDDLQSALQRHFDGRLVSLVRVGGEHTAVIEPADLLSIGQTLRDAPDLRFEQTSATSENRSRKDSSFIVAEDFARGTRSLFCSALHKALKVDRAMLASKVTLGRAFAL